MILTYYTATTLIIIAYLLGSIPSAVWIGKKYYGIDIREHGSKNAGTTNMLRVLCKRAALHVFGLDVLKGFVAVTIIDLMKYDSVFADGANETWFYILRFIGVGIEALEVPGAGGERQTGGRQRKESLFDIVSFHSRLSFRIGVLH